MKCPKGHEMIKKRIGTPRRIATECPNDFKGEGKCCEYRNCRLQHNIKNCYLCLECGKHYARYEPVKVLFT